MVEQQLMGHLTLVLYQRVRLLKSFSMTTWGELGASRYLQQRCRQLLSFNDFNGLKSGIPKKGRKIICNDLFDKQGNVIPTYPYMHLGLTSPTPRYHLPRLGITLAIPPILFEKPRGKELKGENPVRDS